MNGITCCRFIDPRALLRAVELYQSISAALQSRNCSSMPQSYMTSEWSPFLNLVACEACSETLYKPHLLIKPLTFCERTINILIYL